MNNEVIQNIRKIRKSLENKDFKIYLFVQDTRNLPLAHVEHTYQVALSLKELGFDVNMIHEKNDYAIPSWTNTDYSVLNHISIESNQQIVFNVEDIVIINERQIGFAHNLRSNNVGSEIVMLCLTYEYILDTLMPGFSWKNYGINQVIVTNETVQKYIVDLMGEFSFHIVPVAISDEFKPSVKPRHPKVFVCARDIRDYMKLAKSFYLKYPLLKFISFIDARGMDKKTFASTLGESFMAVWIDENASFGTFAIEAMKSKTPLISIIPKLNLPYVKEGTGIWLSNKENLTDIVNRLSQILLQGDAPEKDFFENVSEFVDQYNVSQQKEKLESFLNEIVNTKIKVLDDNIENMLITN